MTQTFDNNSSYDSSSYDSSATQGFDGSASLSSHGQSGFEMADGNFASEYSGAIIDDASQHSQWMNATSVNSDMDQHSDLSQQYGVELFHVSGLEMNDFNNQLQDYPLPDSTNLHHPQSNYHQNIGYEEISTYSDRSHESANLSQNEYHFPITEQLQVMNCHDNCPYTTISNSGLIYKYTSDSSSGDWVGKVDGRSVYNTSSHYLGYAGTDGKVYDNDDHCVGWVHGCHVYNKGGEEVYETTKGVVGAAAYLLCVYYGGVN